MTRYDDALTLAEAEGFEWDIYAADPESVCDALEAMGYVWDDKRGAWLGPENPDNPYQASAAATTRAEGASGPRSYERAALRVATLPPDQRIMVVRAVKVGDWYVHLPVKLDDDPGVALSHRSGIRAGATLTPCEAVRVLRRLQSVPPCPVTDDEFRAATSDSPAALLLRPWMRQVLDAVREVAPRWTPQGRRP